MRFEVTSREKIGEHVGSSGRIGSRAKSLFRTLSEALLSLGLIVHFVSLLLRRRLTAALWIGVAVGLCVAPLGLVWIAPARPSAFAWSFALALGSGGLALAGLQFLLTGRFRRATEPFGIDLVYRLHRWAAVAALALLIAHALIIVTGYADAAGGSRPWVAGWPMVSGWLSLGLFILLVASSLGRRILGWEYDGWRRVHALLAVGATAAAIGHVLGVLWPQERAWSALLWSAYAVFWFGALLHVRVLRPWGLLRSPYRVSAVEPVGPRVWTVRMVPERGQAIAFQPGQFVWVTLRAGPFSGREHPYSLSGSAADRSSLAVTIKALGDFTATVGSIRPGERAFVDGPYGAFSPDRHPHASGWILIAGGVGIAPIMSMLRTLADRGDARPIVLVCAHGSPASRLFADELLVLERRLALTVVPVLEEAPPEWNGERGRVTVDVLRRAIASSELSTRECFLCGPVPMTDAVARSLRQLGLPARRIHVELFDMA